MLSTKLKWSLINKHAKNRVSSTCDDFSSNDFNDFFVSYVKDVRNGINKSPIVDPHLLVGDYMTSATMSTWSLITEMHVLEIIMKMKPSKSKDIFDMSNDIIKYVALEILTPLTYCINKCLNDGVFPSRLKTARVIPLFKGGDKSLMKNYRPISLVPVLGKIIETIAKNQLTAYFDAHNLFSSDQYGFRKGISTMDAIETIVTNVYTAMENGELAQITACDLTKAFDCVDHRILLRKLAQYGVSGNALNFFKSYLENRFQIVDLDGVRSDPVVLESGVPQGSILGPLMFLVMINDLPNNVKSAKAVLFADDTNFLTRHKDLTMLNCMTSNAFKEASAWFESNCFSLNDAKTQKIICTSGNRLLYDQSTQSIKFLGIHIDKNLNWNAHIDFVATKLSSVLYLLKSLVSEVPSHYVRSAYFSYFQSVVSYGLVIWGNASKINDILLLQKKAIRILTGSSYTAHCRPLFVATKILTVINLYIYHILNYVKVELHNFNVTSTNYSTRQQNQLEIPFCRLTRTQNSHRVMGLKLFNKLDISVRDMSKSVFSDKLYSWLLLNPFYKIDEFLEYSCIYI